MASFAEKLANVVSRHDEISALLSSPDVGADDLVRMNKELAALTPVVEAIHEYNHAEKNMADAKAMMDDSSLDKEMREMAEAEFYELKEKLPELEKQIKILLLPKDAEDVATGIGEGKAAQPQPKPAAKIAQDYLKESFIPAVNTPETPSEEVDSNLEKFAATAPEAEADTVEKMIDTATIVSFDQPEEVSEIEEPAVQASVEEEKFEDFNNLEASSIINDMPQASSLFKAIINKNEDINADAQLDSILSAKENSFTAKTSLKTVEEEPELFPNHNPKPFSASRKEEPERLIVNDDDEEYTPTLIERVTGFSIAKRNRKKMAKESERFQEPVSPSFSNNDYDPEDKLNLEIPSFLRRKS